MTDSPAADQAVAGHACAACAAGKTNPAGDDASGADTACAQEWRLRRRGVGPHAYLVELAFSLDQFSHSRGPGPPPRPPRHRRRARHSKPGALKAPLAEGAPALRGGAAAAHVSSESAALSLASFSARSA